MPNGKPVLLGYFHNIIIIFLSAAGHLYKREEGNANVTVRERKREDITCPYRYFCLWRVHVHVQYHVLYCGLRTWYRYCTGTVGGTVLSTCTSTVEEAPGRTEQQVALSRYDLHGTLSTVLFSVLCCTTSSASTLSSLLLSTSF